jgi:hypothetical protein
VGMNREIASAFGTDKLAAQGKWSPIKGGLPLAALLGGALLYSGMRGASRQDSRQNELRQGAVRNLESDRFAGTNAALRGGVPLGPIGGSIYSNERADSNALGDTAMFDKGASASGEMIGRLLAKHSGIGGSALGGLKSAGNFLKPGWKTKALVGAGALGTGYAAVKGLRATSNFMQAPSEDRRLGGHSASLPNAVNQFGVPVMG